MALILSIETATSVCSVALHQNASLVASAEVHIEQSHASKLALLIEEVLKTAGILSTQLNAVAISAGPGSYTGLRIGTSTAKGLCYARNLPLISFNSLECMAYQVNKFNINKALLCSMIDARRMEVYCTLLDANLVIIQPTQAKVIDENSFLEYLEKNEILFFGNGAQKCESIISHANAKFISNIFPAASQVGTTVEAKFQKNNFEDLVTFEPHYLKEFMIKKPGVI